MSAPAKTFTLDEFAALPDDGLIHELIRGELQTTTRPGIAHGVIMSRIARLLDVYVQMNHLGVVVAGDAGFILSRDDATVVGPDVAFVPTADLPASDLPEKWLNAAPALAVEISSPTDRLTDIDEKVDLYLAAGSQLVWVVNPRRQSVTIHRPAAPGSVLGAADTLTGESLLPGFSCQVADLFAR